MEVHKLICDECGKEKDLLDTVYGGVDTWQEIQGFETHYRFWESRTLHFCSMDCIIKHYHKSKLRTNCKLKKTINKK